MWRVCKSSKIKHPGGSGSFGRTRARYPFFIYLFIYLILFFVHFCQITPLKNIYSFRNPNWKLFHFLRRKKNPSADIFCGKVNTTLSFTPSKGYVNIPPIWLLLNYQSFLPYLTFKFCIAWITILQYFLRMWFILHSIAVQNKICYCCAFFLRLKCFRVNVRLNSICWDLNFTSVVFFAQTLVCIQHNDNNGST